MRTKSDPKARFMALVSAVPESGCWLWLGCITRVGYGLFNNGEKNRSAHRASHELFKGPIPENMMVLHTCDVKSCVNPNHLYLGDASQNAKDAVERGQKPTGDRHWRRQQPDRQKGDDAPHRKLTSVQVREILASLESQTTLSKKYGVSIQQIHRIVHRQSWRELGSN